MSGQAAYSTYSPAPADHYRISSVAITTSKQHHDGSEYAVNRFSQKYDSYHGLLYRNEHHRRRLSSTGEGSGDSSTTTSGSGSSYGEREEGSEGRAESDELEQEKEHRQPLEGQVTDAEKLQVETFFRGLKTEVFVSSSLANLYTKAITDVDWQLKFTGIPVVILDVGEARSRDKRRLQIVLAERGTCFMLWHDVIDNLTSYKVAGKAFHTMFHSTDHTVQIGFSFDTQAAAQEMWTHVERLVACPENIQLSVPGKKKKRKEKKPPKPAPLPPKSHISQPCCFQHITSVEQDDRSRFYSLQEFVPKISYSKPH